MIKIHEVLEQYIKSLWNANSHYTLLSPSPRPHIALGLDATRGRKRIIKAE